MRIAFYAPMKSPNHPVPSGDRLMAQLLVRALEMAGHSVDIVSDFRVYAGAPEVAAELAIKAKEEAERLRRKWRDAPKPQLWFCYHPYYKSPDLFGPSIATEFAIPYVTAEASYSRRRDQSGWAAFQQAVGDAIRQAAVNIAFTERDRKGLEEVFPQAGIAPMKPFIDVAPFAAITPAPAPHRLMAVAMMRAGDKMESYRFLAAALRLIEDRPWTLGIIGDGPLRAEVEALFAGFAPGRIDWLGQRGPEEVPGLLSKSDIYVWPGCGEAYGLAYLEAQAAGLPVVAQRTAGVPAVVEADVTGLLTPHGDLGAYAQAVAGLLDERGRRDTIASAARRFVIEERSLVGAAKELDLILRNHAGAAYDR
jgi:glycosyltransferase involved in cell wall biosynthesis